MVNGACLTMFVNGWNFVVQVYYIPTFYQLVYGYGPVKAGTLLLPLVLMQSKSWLLRQKSFANHPLNTALSSTLSGLVVSWLGRYREVILAGWAVWAIGLGLFSTLDEHSGLGKQVGYGLLMGLGVGQTLQPSLVAIQAGVSRKEMAVVTATRKYVVCLLSCEIGRIDVSKASSETSVLPLDLLLLVLCCARHPPSL